MTTANAGSNSDAVITGSRVQLAALTRLLHKEGILTYSGHASIRIPGRDAFMIQSINDSRAVINPEGLLICDFDCNLLEGPAGDRGDPGQERGGYDRLNIECSQPPGTGG